MKRIVITLLMMILCTLPLLSIAAEGTDSRILVAYFSATGNTKAIAQTVANDLGADLYEIVPEDPYTEADLAYYTGGRCDQEQDDPSVRPGIAGGIENMDQYELVVIGHPIWHGQAPRIISTFLESYDFSGKTLVTFCTSHSSPLGSSAQNLHSLVPGNVIWLNSRRFPGDASVENVKAWVDTEIIPYVEENMKGKALTLKIDGTFVTVEWEKNDAILALSERIKDAPLTVQMSMYGGFEQVGSLGTSLPREDQETTTSAGDIVLYAGNQIVVFYGSNSWAYTRLGHITDKTPAEMRELLGKHDVTVTLSFD